ncbi:hypothetical protein [Natrialba taiwanensis]|uniref:hypothetical protein n=1 Tax=Natrialba taiwanensis TaxID=160846 RepID=UPI00135F1567|nr:hypothetical protein [Natrialba taiwanensis]
MNGAALQRFSMILLLFVGAVEISGAPGRTYSHFILLTGLIIGIVGLSNELG